ncbi:MAG: response regulator [Candidatus Lokiarchaeota archaeon]|nr:response regulator [Candidatus Lokiarchaeota archaeon]
MQVNIIIIDDDTNVRNVTTKILERLGYGVFTAKEGDSALKIIQKLKDKINCALIDLSIPGTNISDLTKKIRLINPNIIIIIVSGSFFNENDIKLRNIDFDKFLNKPYTMDQLNETLKSKIEPTLI